MKLRSRRFADPYASLAVSIPSSTGWVALAFPAEPSTMPGSTAVIATSSSDNGIGVYRPGSRSLFDVEEITDQEIVEFGIANVRHRTCDCSFWHCTRALSSAPAPPHITWLMSAAAADLLWRTVVVCMSARVPNLQSLSTAIDSAWMGAAGGGAYQQHDCGFVHSRL